MNIASDHSPSDCSQLCPVRCSRFATPVTLLSVQSFRNWPSFDENRSFAQRSTDQADA